MQFSEFTEDANEEKTVVLQGVPRPYRIGLQTGPVTRYIEIMALSLQDAIDTAQRIADAENANEGSWF